MPRSKKKVTRSVPLPLRREGWPCNHKRVQRLWRTPCNEWKGDRTLGESRLNVLDSGSGWDGLESLIVPLRAYALRLAS